MSALAARVLARRNSRVMALIGNGAQSEFQALAFRDLLGITTLHLHDVDARASAKLLRNLRGQRLDVRVFDSADDAVRGADIVTTITADKRNATIVTPDMVEPGMHFNAVGGDCPGKTELHADVLRRAAVFVEYEPQTRVEGDLQQMPADFAVTELWRVLALQAAGRTSVELVTVFDSVGFALVDHSALHFRHDAARRLHIGSRIDLVPRTRDPKDLFATISRASQPLVD
jgi:ornithine cyclodeaminase